MQKLIAFLAMTGLAASPVGASVRDAAFSSSADRAPAQTSIFAGATYRLGLDGRAGKTRGRAGLNLSGMVMSPDASDIRIGQGLEVADGKTGRPALFVAGREAGKLGDRARVGTGGTVALVVVGVVIVAGVAVALAVDERLDRQNSE